MQRTSQPHCHDVIESCPSHVDVSALMNLDSNHREPALSADAARRVFTWPADRSPNPIHSDVAQGCFLSGSVRRTTCLMLGIRPANMLCSWLLARILRLKSLWKEHGLKSFGLSQSSLRHTPLWGTLRTHTDSGPFNHPWCHQTTQAGKCR